MKVFRKDENGDGNDDSDEDDFAEIRRNRKIVSVTVEIMSFIVLIIMMRRGC